ncbi:uncharacterized protein RAG0_04067 [Rhynchosporium agropyri]|uniref:Uncharacterized protein n=1 Tax=Rhynchosporium agropyri TaxID=914238 RepID=A0A1E1K7R4_9HELO|nr:uncharacterized protein RAG0_04067 [Rhynchosporium agropyri]
MKITIVYLSLATRVVLANALDNHVQLRAHQQDSDEDSGYDPTVEYWFRMCNPFYWEYLDKPGPSKYTFGYTQAPAFSLAPCDQLNFIHGACVANGTNSSLDFAQSSNVFAAVTFGTPMLAATNAIGSMAMHFCSTKRRILHIGHL